LLRLRVHSATQSYVTYYTQSGVAVDRATGAPLGQDSEPLDDSPLAQVRRSDIDAARAFEGVAPEQPRFYSSFERFETLRDLALVRYGVLDAPPLGDDDALADLRRRMIAAHPDHGGSEAAFTEARAAFEAARNRLDD